MSKQVNVCTCKLVLEEKVKTQNVAARNTREGKGAGQPGTQATKVINQETQVRKLFVGAGGF